MTILRIVIIEDEPLGRENLRNLLLEYCKNIEIVGMAGTVDDGIGAIQNLQPDLVFMDIELYSGTGFEILESVNRTDFELVFTTAFENYAIQAIKFSAIDYLLKPIDLRDLCDAVEKARLRREENNQNRKLASFLQNMNHNDKDQKIITLSTVDGFEFVPISDIVRLEANGAYTVFFLKSSKKLMVSKNLKEFEVLLSGYKFYRVHHSYLINLNEVEKYVKSDRGYIILKDGSRVEISQRKKERFMELMSSRNI